jgi:nicotinate-nucleotide adenylyltransferase
LGGSFDPPHPGHVHLSREAIKRFGLDRVIWLVSPGNPLKSRQPASMEQRLRAARNLVHDPRILVSDLELHLRTRFTHDTLQELTRLWPEVRFVWLMGGDNLVQFHRWQHWQDIMSMLPVGVLARPGTRMAALNSPTVRRFRGARLEERNAVSLPDRAAPAWCFVNMPMLNDSSTEIRNRGDWPMGDNAARNASVINELLPN